MDNLNNLNKTENPNELSKLEGSESKFRPQMEIMDGQQGWLSPSGKFYPCTEDEHDECARYLLSDKHADQYLQEVLKTSEEQKPDDLLPPRLRIEKDGYILIHGVVLPSGKFNSLTTQQKNLIISAKITITDPVGNAECSLESLQEIKNNLKERLKKVKESSYYKESLEIVQTMISRLHIDSTEENLHKYMINRGNTGVTYLEANCLGDILAIDDLEKDPLSAAVTLDEYGKHDQYLTSAPLIFDSLTQGFLEGVRLPPMGEFLHNYRLLNTGAIDRYVVVDKAYHAHGLSADSSPDYSQINCRVLSKKQITELISSYLTRYKQEFPTRNPQLSYEGNPDVFKI